MLKRARYAVLLLLSLAAAPSLAAADCDCLWQGGFTRSSAQADLVVQANVLTHKGNSMDVAIEKRWRGQEYLDHIRIWGDNGELCRPSIYQFEPGERWILALRRIETVPDDGFNPNTPNLSYGRERDYEISSCGVNWLRVNDNLVTGNLVEAPRWQYIDHRKSPVLLELVQGWLDGQLDESILRQAATPDQAPKELMHETQMYMWGEQGGRETLLDILREIEAKEAAEAAAKELAEPPQ